MTPQDHERVRNFILVCWNAPIGGPSADLLGERSVIVDALERLLAGGSPLMTLRIRNIARTMSDTSLAAWLEIERLLSAQKRGAQQ